MHGGNHPGRPKQPYLRRTDQDIPVGQDTLLHRVCPEVSDLWREDMTGTYEDI
jgi:hypothetical protein